MYLFLIRNRYLDNFIEEQMKITDIKTYIVGSGSKSVLKLDPESSEKLCIFTGEILNYNVDVAEIMAILAAVEIFKYLAIVSKQKMVIYTDSLTAKKILSDKRLPPGSKLYSGLRKQFLKIVKGNNFDVVIKKVEAHSGIVMNELADKTAKKRLSRLIIK